MQLSLTGACSQRYGPRLSAWQLVQLSSIVVPAFSSLTFVLPCTLWQEAHVSAPSRTGIWLKRCCLFVILRWQLAHCCVTVLALSWAGPFDACTLWHVVQPMLR